MNKCPTNKGRVGKARVGLELGPNNPLAFQGQQKHEALSRLESRIEEIAWGPRQNVHRLRAFLKWLDHVPGSNLGAGDESDPTRNRLSKEIP